MPKKHTKKHSKKTIKTHSINTIKLVIELNTLFLEELLATVINKKSKSSTSTSSFSVIRRLLQNFMDTNGFKYNDRSLDKLTKQSQLIIASLVTAYGKPLPKHLFKSSSTRGSKFKSVITGGGPYLGHLIDKGDQPITGNDFKKATDDISQILFPVMFTPALVEGFNVFTAATILDIFTGNDVESSKNYFKWHMSDKYFSLFPPSIHTENIWPIIKEAQNYLNVYFTHQRIKNQALQEDGKLNAADIKPSALEQMAQKYFDIEMELQMSLINPLSLNKFNPSVFIKANV
jgi:hypothetical protein